MNTTQSIAYVHIPKCAGSMLKNQLRQIDQTDGRYEKIIDHPEFGKIHTAHLPLWLMERMYPDDFAAFRACTSYTVVRNPFDRFQSAMAQRLAEFTRTDIFSLDQKALEKEIDDVISFLSENPTRPTRKYVHFLRQVDFVQLDGERIVDRIYRLEAIKDLMQDMEAQTGLKFVYSLKSNQKLNFRFKALKRPVYAVNAMVKQILPMSVYGPLKDATSRLLTKSPTEVKQSILKDKKTREFIESHYAADFDLYEKAGA